MTPPRTRPAFRFAALVLACSIPLASAEETRLIGTLSAGTDDVYLGLSQNSGRPVAQAGIGVRAPHNLYAMAWASTLDTSHQRPDTGDGDGWSVATLVGYGRALDDASRWNAGVTAGYSSTHGTDQKLGYDYEEYGASVDYRGRVRLAGAWSPRATDHTRINTKLQGPRWSVELAGEWPLGEWVSASGGFGYCDLTDVADVDYTYWSAGLNLRWDRHTLGLTHFGTDADARARYPDGRADARTVISLVTAFGR